MGSGLLLFLGNSESPMNYRDNPFHFRQDSSFLYYFGIDRPGLVAIIDVDNNKETIFGEEYTMDDIIWRGPQPTIAELAQQVGVKEIENLHVVPVRLVLSKSEFRDVHFLPPYRSEHFLKIQEWLILKRAQILDGVSIDFIKAIVEQRSIKTPEEIEEIEKAVNLTADMHITAMRLARPGMKEVELAAAVQQVAVKNGGQLSFPTIMTINGETLHNHYHGNMLQEGKLMLTDTGAETTMHYASDNTRTVPVGGKFSQKQKDIYNIVLNANNHAISLIKPDVPYRDIHLESARIIAEGLTKLGIMKGNPEDAVREGAHAMFMPHGLGHMMGLDVHDMENLGEDYVGYDNEFKRASQFGLRGLRLGRKLQEGFVLTTEPGIYFIPDLVKKWKTEKINANFINFDKVLNEYIDFGGIRLEDDILVTKTGHQMIGKRIPITVEEVEETMKS